MKRKAQFFIITTVLIAGALLLIVSLFSSSDTDYTEVVQQHDTTIMQNVVDELSGSWWNQNWTRRVAVTIEERNGDYLTNYPVPVVIPAKNRYVRDDCGDIRVIRNGKQLPWNTSTTTCDIDTYNSRTSAMARYKLDEGGGQWANDSTRNGYNAELGGDASTAQSADPTWATGRFGTGLLFDGNDDYVRTGAGVPVADTDGSSFSMSAWIRTDSDGAIVGKMRDAFSDGDSDSNILIQVGGGVVEWRLEYDGSNDEDYLSGSTTVTDGNWHHVTGIRDGWEFLIYVDGELDARYTQSDYYVDDGNHEYDEALKPSTELHIGQYRDGHYFDGQIDDVRIYDHALQPDQVKGIYQNGIDINISVNLTPEEETDELYVYFDNPFSLRPRFNESDFNHVSLTNPPVVTRIGPSRSVDEIEEKLAATVQRFNEELGGHTLELTRRDGCDLLTMRSSFAVLQRPVC